MNNKGSRIPYLELIAQHFIAELKAIFTDKGALLIIIGALIIYPLAYSFGYFNEVISDLKIGLVDLDNSGMSRKYTRMLDATQELKVDKSLTSIQEAEELFMQNEIEGVIVIPQGFQSDILKGNSTNIGVYADASYFLKYKATYMAASVVNSYFSGGVGVKRYMFDGYTFDQAKVANDPLPVYRSILYNPTSGYASYLMPGLVLIIIQQTLLIGIGILGGSFSGSKKSPFLLPDTDRKMEVIPYLTGKVGAYLLISLINFMLAGIIIHHWFSYPDKGELLQVLALLFPFVFSVTVLGIGFSTFFHHRESAIVFMVFLSPIALFLSGMSWPTSAIPQWLVYFSKIIPSTTAVPAYLKLRTMGVDISELKTEMFTLYGMAIVYTLFTLAYFYYRIYKNQHHVFASKN